MKKLLLISLFSISFVVCAQNGQGIMPGGCVVTIEQNSVEDTALANRIIITAYIRGRIADSRGIAIAEYFNRFGHNLNFIYHGSYTLQDVADLFCIPKLFDEYARVGLFKNVFIHVDRDICANYRSTPLQQIVPFMNAVPSLEQIMQDSENEQEQKMRLRVREILINNIIEAYTFLKEHPKIAPLYARLVMLETKKLVSAFKITFAQN